MEKALPGHKLHILLAEDDPDIAEMNRFALEAAGHSVVVARDGAAALEAIRAGGPDLLVLDLEMPRANGFEVLASLRSLPGTSALPVVVLSNKEVSADERSLLETFGIKAFLAKWQVGPKALVGWAGDWAASQPRANVTATA